MRSRRRTQLSMVKTRMANRTSSQLVQPAWKPRPVLPIDRKPALAGRASSRSAFGPPDDSAVGTNSESPRRVIGSASGSPGIPVAIAQGTGPSTAGPARDRGALPASPAQRASRRHGDCPPLRGKEAAPSPRSGSAAEVATAFGLEEEPRPHRPRVVVSMQLGRAGGHLPRPGALLLCARSKRRRVPGVRRSPGRTRSGARGVGSPGGTSCVASEVGSRSARRCAGPGAVSYEDLVPCSWPRSGVFTSDGRRHMVHASLSGRSPASARWAHGDARRSPISASAGGVRLASLALSLHALGVVWRRRDAR